MIGIFVGIHDDASGWLFYVPSAKRSYISLDAIFDESFTSPLVLPDLPYQGAIRLRGTGRHILNQDTPHEHTGAPTGQEETFPHEDYDMPHPSRHHIISDISDLVSYPKRGNHNTPKEEARHTQTTNNPKNIQTEDQPSTTQYDKIKAYFTTMKNCPEDIDNAEYMNISHEQIQTSKTVGDMVDQSLISFWHLARC